MNLPEVGLIIQASVSHHRQVYVTMGDHDVIIGTIDKKEWSWLEQEEVSACQDIQLVVLGHDFNGLKFGRKQLHSLDNALDLITPTEVRALYEDWRQLKNWSNEEQERINRDYDMDML